jgi:hypothetical protein
MLSFAAIPGHLGDVGWSDLMDLGAVEFDQEKRPPIYQKGIDEGVKMKDTLPVAYRPPVFVHSKNVKINDNALSPIDIDVNDFVWSN